MATNKCIVTGGAGYIGSHCALSLLDKGYKVVVLDNLSTGHMETVQTLQNYGDLTFYDVDLTNDEKLHSVIKEISDADAVFHFAAFSQVGESVINPQKYYENNILGSLNLFKEMLEFDIKKLVFSSTAAVYGEPDYVPIDEKHSTQPINTYGKTKLFIEKILDDYDKAYNLKSVRLRYFNVAGADSKNRVGEWHEPESHLIPNILKSTLKSDMAFDMYGDDYNTKDGTCIRDYINVEDLISAHLLALDYLNNRGKTDFFNIGTNNGNSIKEVLSACEEVTGKTILINKKPRREGDPATLVADNTKAKNVLNWSPRKTIKDSIESAYKWEQKNNKI